MVPYRHLPTNLSGHQIENTSAATDGAGATTDFIADLQAAVDAALVTSGFAAGDVVLSEAGGVESGLPNRIVFASELAALLRQTGRSADAEQMETRAQSIRTEND